MTDTAAPTVTTATATTYDKSEYRAVWLTWDLVSPSAAGAARAAPNKDEGKETARNGAPGTDAFHHENHRLELRHRSQRARVEKRLSVDDLAVLVRCDSETLAAFERGDEVLSAEHQQRLRKVLEV